MRWIHGSALFAAGAMAGIFSCNRQRRHKKRCPGLRLNHFGIYVKDLDESTNFYMKRWAFDKRSRSRTAPVSLSSIFK